MHYVFFLASNKVCAREMDSMLNAGNEDKRKKSYEEIMSLPQSYSSHEGTNKLIVICNFCGENPFHMSIIIMINFISCHAVRVH